MAAQHDHQEPEDDVDRGATQTTRSGGVDVQADNVTVQGDIVGRDQTNIRAETYIEHAVIVQGPGSFQQISALASDGLTALVGLMQISEVRTAVVAFQTDFQAASEQIGILGEYKRLHDLFQELENLYYLIDHDRRRLPADESAWESLMMNEPELRSKIDDVLEAAQSASFAAEEATWIGQLAKVREELQKTIDDLDLAQLTSITRRLSRVLNLQPSRINARLLATAGTLRLEAIVKAMTTVRDGLADSDSDAEALGQFESGREALARLNDDLSALVRNHNSWQEIDDELRRVEANLGQDIIELQETWPDLNLMFARVYDDDGADWAVTLKGYCRDLEGALQAQATLKVKRAFRGIRSTGGRRFRQVDYNLLQLSRDLQSIGEPLNILLRTIQ